jgi:hypothetical protein
MKKMTMGDYENSAEDKKADASGRHGPEGSAKDKSMDRKALNKINSDSAWHGFGKPKK